MSACPKVASRIDSHPARTRVPVIVGVGSAESAGGVAVLGTWSEQHFVENTFVFPPIEQLGSGDGSVPIQIPGRLHDAVSVAILEVAMLQQPYFHHRR